VVAQKRLPKDITKIVDFFWLGGKTNWPASWSESTYNWYWLVDGLQDAASICTRQHTAAIKAIRRTEAQRRRDGTRSTSPTCCAWHPADRHDPAEGAARRARSGAQAMQLVAQLHTTHVLAVENIMARRAGRADDQQSDQAADRRWVDSLPLAADVGLAVKANVAVMPRCRHRSRFMEKHA